MRVESAASVDGVALDALCVRVSEASGELVSSSLGRLPLRFDSMAEHVSFIATAHVLLFGAGFWKQVGVRLPVVGVPHRVFEGLLGAFLSGCKFDTDWMTRVKPDEVARMLGLRVRSDVATSIAGVTEEKKNELFELAELGARALNGIAAKLWARRAASLGAFIDAFVRRAAPCSAVRLADELSSTFDEFRDVVRGRDGAEHVARDKAVHLAWELHVALGDEDAAYRLDDTSALAPLTTTPVMAALMGARVLVVRDDAFHVASGAPTVASAQSAVATRAAAAAAASAAPALVSAEVLVEMRDAAARALTQLAAAASGDTWRVYSVLEAAAAAATGAADVRLWRVSRSAHV